jgi:hypothetical protein
MWDRNGQHEPDVGVSKETPPQAGPAQMDELARGYSSPDEAERSLNPRVRGSSPWRRTPSDLAFLSSEGREGIAFRAV